MSSRETKLLAGTASSVPDPPSWVRRPVQEPRPASHRTARPIARAEGLQARDPRPQLPAPPFTGDVPPQGDPSSSPRWSPPPQRLPASNPGSLHPPASLLPSTFFVSPSLASRHLLQAPSLPPQTLLFPPQTLVSSLPLFPDPVTCPHPASLSPISPIYAQTQASPPPLSIPASLQLGLLPPPRAWGVDVSRSPRSMQPEGLPRWAQAKGPSLAPAERAGPQKSGLCRSDRCLGGGWRIVLRRPLR